MQEYNLTKAKELNGEENVNKPSGILIIDEKDFRAGMKEEAKKTPKKSIQEWLQGIKRKIPPAGNFRATTGLATIIKDKSKTLGSMATVLSHELSHAAVARKINLIVEKTNDWYETKQVVTAVGLEIIENNTLKGEGLEQGMAYWNQMDFYEQYLSNILPEDNAERTKDAQIELEKVNQEAGKLFYPITEDVLKSHMLYISDSAKVKRLFEHYFIDINAIRNIRLMQELASVIGYVSSKNEGKLNHAGNYKKEGRNILEKDRFSGKTTSIEIIRKVFGNEQAEFMLNIDQNSFTARTNKQIIEAMQMVRDKQQELVLE